MAGFNGVGRLRGIHAALIAGTMAATPVAAQPAPNGQAQTMPDGSTLVCQAPDSGTLSNPQNLVTTWHGNNKGVVVVATGLPVVQNGSPLYNADGSPLVALDPDAKLFTPNGQVYEANMRDPAGFKKATEITGTVMEERARAAVNTARARCGQSALKPPRPQ